MGIPIVKMYLTMFNHLYYNYLTFNNHNIFIDR